MDIVEAYTKALYSRYRSGWASGHSKKTWDSRGTIRDIGRGSGRDLGYHSKDEEGDEPQTYESIRAMCLADGCLWEDPDFPADDSSIYFANPPSVPLEWLRPHEICEDPQLTVGGASRLDVNQGILGDCWFLAAVACLASDQRLLNNVVPPDQSFSEEYAGIFKFNFWQYGRWVEIVVDDRLPTYNGKLVYMHSEESNEFWTALLEKAYAKLNGSYEALSGGLTSEAMTDFSGGVVEKLNLGSEAPDFSFLLKAKQKGSLMGCSIDADPGQLEARLDNGLVMGHAYSITDVRKVPIETSRVSGVIPLVRVRNPWGNECEWKGAWSDQSQEWQLISDEDRESMGLTFDHDGEFWMSYEDFKSNFQRLELCFLGPDTMTTDDDPREMWQMTLLDGEWKKRVNAGGCRNFPETFPTNPQYQISISDADDDDPDGCGTVIVGVMQKGRRRLRKEGQDNLTIGYAIYTLDEGQSGNMDYTFFMTRKSTARSPNFINMREVCGHHKLPLGNYVIVPSTFEPNLNAEFIVRVFTEKKVTTTEMDEETGRLEVDRSEMGEDTDEDREKQDAAKNAFKELAGEDMEVDAYELRDIVNHIYTRGMPDSCTAGFSLEACRGLVAMKDEDASGKLGYEEFKALWGEMKYWRKVFEKYDSDQTGHFSCSELRRAIHAVGYRVSNSTFNCLVMRYSDKEGNVCFEDFITCVMKLQALFAIFKEKDPEGNGTAEFSLDEFVQMTLYT